MTELTGQKRKALRGMAHDLKPVVQVGKQGLTDAVVNSIDTALNDHELIKVKFVDFKDEKKVIAPEIAQKTKSHWVGMVGNIAMFYRENADPKKRKIQI